MIKRVSIDKEEVLGLCFGFFNVGKENLRRRMREIKRVRCILEVT